MKILEDYIAELAKSQFDNRQEFIEASSVIARLMDIIIEEERRIPDFVVDGDKRIDDDFWPNFNEDDDSDFDHIFFADEEFDEDSDGYISDPGIINRQVTFSMAGIVSTQKARNNDMRSFKWTVTMILVGLIGFAVGLLTAP